MCTLFVNIEIMCNIWMADRKGIQLVKVQLQQCEKITFMGLS